MLALLVSGVRRHFLDHLQMWFLLDLQRLNQPINSVKELLKRLCEIFFAQMDFELTTFLNFQLTVSAIIFLIFWSFD